MASPRPGVLVRGSVLALVSGKLELVTATNQATVYGGLLDPRIDTVAKFSDNSVTGSVARAGSFRGAALIVSTGTHPVALAADLRDLVIYVEGPDHGSRCSRGRARDCTAAEPA